MDWEKYSNVQSQKIITDSYLIYTLQGTKTNKTYKEVYFADVDDSICLASPSYSPDEVGSPNQNSTDEEKLLISGIGVSMEQKQADFSLNNRPYLAALFSALECSENDYEALFVLCLLYAIGQNTGTV